jgi:hypothetical protein
VFVPCDAGGQVAGRLGTPPAGGPGALDAEEAPTAEYLVGRALARGRTGLQASNRWWRDAALATEPLARRRELLRGALAELDEEMGPHVAEVSGA